MGRRTWHCLVALLSFCGSTAAADLNGFLREKGHGDVALSYTTEGYDEFWVGDEKVSDPGVGEVDTRTLFYSSLRAEDGTDIMDPGFTFPSNEEEYDRIGGRVYGRITDHFGVSGAYFTNLDGRNTGDASGVSIGINVRY